MSFQKQPNQKQIKLQEMSRAATVVKLYQQTGIVKPVAAIAVTTQVYKSRGYLLDVLSSLFSGKR